MIRLFLCALLLAPSAAMADPISSFLSLSAYYGTTVSAFLISIVPSATFWLVAPGLIVGNYMKKRAERKAREAYNAGLQDRTTMIRTATEPRDLVLGRVRKSGVMYPIGQSGSKSEKMVFAILLAGHECDAIEAVWFNDKAVTLDGSGVVTSDDWAKTEKRSESAAVPQTVTTVTLPYDPVAGSVSVQRSTDWKVSNVSVAGRVVTWTRTYASPGYNANATTVFQVHYQRNVVTPRARVWWHLGTDGQAADSRLIELFPDKWSAARRLAGITYALVELDYDQDIFSAGITNVSFVMRGAKVYDPRTGLTAWSENPALLLRHAALHSLCGNLPAVAGEHDSIIAAANACDVTVSTTVSKDGTDTTTTGPRFVAGYVFKGGNRPKDALDELAEAMGGKWAVVGNQLVVKAGEYSAPLLSLGDNDFSDAGAVQVSPGRPREQMVNVVTGKFADKANGYQVLDFPRVASDPDILKDGAELPLDVEFAAVPEVAQSQHLGAIMIRDGRQALTVAASFKLRAYRVELFDTIYLSNSVYGFSSKAFEVLSRSWSLGGLLRLTLKETAPGIYARATEFEGVDIAPNTSLPDPRNVPTVTGLAATSGATQTPDGTLIPRVRVSWSAFADEAMSSGVVELRYWPASGSPDNAQTAEAPASALSALIDGLTGGAPVIITARARNGVPVRGDWCTQIVHTVASVTVTASDNLIRNPAFDDSGQEWAAGDTLPASDPSVPPGAPSARVLRSSIRDYYARDTATGAGLRYAVRPSTTYEFQCWVGLNASLPVDVGLISFSYGSDGTDLQHYPGASILGNFTGWRRVSAQITTRADQYYLMPNAWIGQNGNGYVAHFSTPIIRELSAAVIAAREQAIAAAASDATAKAAAAQAAASAYAAAQANAADVSARAYADGIVTAEEDRAIADATAKANAARIAAEAAAAADATAKAVAAQAAAVSVASADATAKSAAAQSAAQAYAAAQADSARVTASAYADGIVDAEEARAIADAAAKAEAARVAAVAAAAADATAKANVAATTANWDGVLGRPFDYSQSTDPASGGTVTNGSTWLNTSTGKSYLRVSGAWSAYVGSGSIGTAEIVTDGVIDKALFQDVTGATYSNVT